MDKIYCVYCGCENEIEDKKCKKCKKKLNPKNTPWKDYIYKHIKSTLKDKAQDNIFSLIINFVKSHLYGTFMSIALISTGILGIVNVISDNRDSYIENVTEKPILQIVAENLSLDDDTVVLLYDYINRNNFQIIDNDFYGTKLIQYDDFTDEDVMGFVFRYGGSVGLLVQSCEEFLGYDELYNKCVSNPSLMVNNFNVMIYDINKEKLELTFYKMFGSDKVFPKGTFNVYDKVKCSYSQSLDDYLCYREEEINFSDSYKVTKLIKAQKFDDEIIIYDKCIFLINNSVASGTFKDPNLTIKLDSDFNGFLVDEGQVYKHIFKMDASGNYYWFSSKPVLIY